MSKVTNEIINQLKNQGVNLKNRRLVSLGDEALRINTPGKVIGDGKTRSVDIYYDRGSDLYNVSVHKIDKNFGIKTCRSKGIYSDQLPQFFDDKHIDKICKFKK